MALTTESAKPDPKKDAKPAEAKAEDKMPERVAAPGATDPAVHQLLAEQDIAWQNGDAGHVCDINAKLNELGYK